MDPVSPARRIALEVLRRTFEAGSYTDRSFRVLADREGLEGRERSQAQWLAYGAVQRCGTCDVLIGRLANRPAEEMDAAVLGVLRLALFELLFAGARSDHAVLNEAVELTRLAGSPRAAGFVNAVLRRATRERARIEEELRRHGTPEEIAFAESLPQWLAEKWWREVGREGLIGLAKAANSPAERALRLNSERWSLEQARAAADAAGILLELPGGGEAIGRSLPAGGASAPSAPRHPLAAPEMVLPRGSWAAIETWIEEGLATPQSRASAAVVELLDPRPGEHVLDMCAGPGTKTGQIAARLRGQGELVAVEPHPGRAAETADQLRRLGVHIATVVEADAADIDLRGPGYDRVLVDAPCSDLGTLNSRPDARWRKTPESIEEMVRLQHRILCNAVRHLRPGGVLVYSTCTISAAENEEQVKRLLDRQEEEQPARVVADDLGSEFPDLASQRDPRFLQIRPDRHGTSGFFIARLRRPGANAG